MKQNVCIFLLVVSTTSFPAYAYVDPGTTSLFINALVAFLAAGGGMAVIYFRKVSQTAKILFKKLRLKLAVDE